MVRVVPSDATSASGILDTDKFRFDALNPGAWGNDLRVTIEGNNEFKNLSDKKWDKFNVVILLKNVQGIYEIVEKFELIDLDNAFENTPSYITNVVNDEQAGSVNIKVTKINGGVPTQLLSANYMQNIGTGDGANKVFSATLTSTPVLETSVNITDGTQIVTDNGFGQLIGDIDPSGVNKIDYDTGQLTVTFAAPPPIGVTVSVSYTKLAKSVSVDLSGGTDGTGTLGRDELTNPILETSKKGMYAFKLVSNDVINLVIPDLAGNATAAQDQIAFAENVRNVFVVLTTNIGNTVDEAISYVRSSIRRTSEFAAIYYPWIKIVNPITGAVELFPPIGHIVGVYARVDSTKSVGKAPAGLEDGIILGSLGVERVLDKVDRDKLYPARINPLIDEAGIGTVIFGARSLEFDVKKRYLQNRRTLIFLEVFFSRMLDFQLFESINVQLFDRIRLSLSAKLSEFFRQGLFAGSTEAEAFFVKVDRENNPPELGEQGIVRADIGVALTKPMEFAVLTIIKRKFVV
ncbi:MAG: phage tail sheath subtilisin-like domain-containing protein [Nitrososphaerota archaeon]